jgi:hypothetical protein
VTKLQVVLEHHSMDLRVLAEVEYERNLEIRRRQERESLRVYVRWETSPGLCLDHQLAIDQHVDAFTRERLAAKIDRDPHLALDCVSLSNQVSLERPDVDVFAKARPELTVNVEARANDRVGKFSEKHARLATET